jgi:hypothetical protein
MVYYDRLDKHMIIIDSNSFKLIKDLKFGLF